VQNIEIEFWQSVQDVHSNKEIWEDVYNSSEASPYLSYEWFATALKYFQGNNRLLIGVMKINKRTMAIVPLEIAKEKIGPLAVNVLRFALEWWSLKNGAIIRDQWNHLFIIKEVIRASREHDSSWKYCRLSKIPASLLLNEEEADERITELQEDALMREPSVVIDVPRSWENYRETVSKAHRKNLSRRLNAIERKGDVRLVRLGLNSGTDPAKLRILMDDAVSVCRNSWQHSTPEGWAISDPMTGGFFFEVSEKLAVKGMLDLSVLYLDDRPVSFIWGSARWPRTTILKLGFDKSLSDLSPGFVHLAKYIMDSIEKEISEIDFGSEFLDYKAGWGKRHDGMFDLFYYSPGILPSIIRKIRSTLHSKKLLRNKLSFQFPISCSGEVQEIR
jgi:CelD/BcsL family acetyltransferase involved in cellulose biosynthesis